VTERETLLGQLTVLIRQMQDDFNQRVSGAKETPKGKNLPEVVNAIVWVRQLEAKVSLYCMLLQYVCIMLLHIYNTVYI